VSHAPDAKPGFKNGVEVRILNVSFGTNGDGFFKNFGGLILGDLGPCGAGFCWLCEKARKEGDVEDCRYRGEKHRSRVFTPFLDLKEEEI
jgi:hypothetical protein